MTPVLSAKEISAGYGELVLVEMPAMDAFAGLGWEVANLYRETFGPEGSEGQMADSEVILVRRLRRALERINPGFPAGAYEQAIRVGRRPSSRLRQPFPIIAIRNQIPAYDRGQVYGTALATGKACINRFG